jgi:glycosyltransferase involved in cell wall biosynthesis
MANKTPSGDTFQVTEPARKVRVMQLIDTLELGGAERMAVNIANGLANRDHQSFLCVTRKSGPLESSINDKVSFFNLRRRHRFDLVGLTRLFRLIYRNKIEIVHAHTSSVFIAVIAKVFSGRLSIVWHDHNGDPTTRSVFPFKLISNWIDYAIGVNALVKEWMVETIGLNPERVSYFPNFAVLDESEMPTKKLPGQEGFRIICVANIRPQKDHMNLLSAFMKVIKTEPRAHLILVGDAPDFELLNEIKQFVDSNRLSESISLLGKRQDVHGIMRGCEIGVLSSKSEGLPVALLEYGLAGLAVVATDVGQCSEILDNGEAGILIPSQESDFLANGLISLLSNPEQRSSLARNLQRRVQEEFSESAFMDRLEGVYESTRR